MAEIVLEGVTKRYPDGSLAVRDVDLDIADGEFVILVGPSGCGKSTTLNMIAGLEDITEGTLRIGGRVVNDLAPKERDVAMVFQSYALYPHMSVRENMGFPLRLAKVDKATVDSKVEEAARVLDLVEFLDRKPANLSGGSASGSPWDGPSSVTPRPSSWTNPCPTWTPSSVCRCAPRSPGCSAGWAPPPCTSPTTRPRP